MQEGPRLNIYIAYKSPLLTFDPAVQTHPIQQSYYLNLHCTSHIASFKQTVPYHAHPLEQNN